MVFKMQITKARWNKLLVEMEIVLHRYATDGYESDMKEEDINLIVNTLKNNTPFEVVDCLCEKGEDENN